MGKALRLNVHPRVITLARILERGERDFNDLHKRDKMLLYDCDLDLDGLVEPEELVEFRLKMQAEESSLLRERVKAHAQLVALNGKQKLGIQQG